MQIFNYPDNIMESFDKLMLPFESDPEKANLTVIANCSQILESLFESDATIEQTYRMLFTKEKILRQPAQAFGVSFREYPAERLCFGYQGQARREWRS